MTSWGREVAAALPKSEAPPSAFARVVRYRRARYLAGASPRDRRTREAWAVEKVYGVFPVGLAARIAKAAIEKHPDDMVEVEPVKSPT